MNETIYESERMVITFDDNHKICEIVLNHNETLLKKFQSDLLTFLDVIKQYKPVKNLWNLTDFAIVIDPEMQEWIDDNINQKEIEIGVRFEAFLMPGDLVEQLSVQQTMEEQYGQSIETQYFSERDTALKWLMSAETEQR